MLLSWLPAIEIAYVVVLSTWIVLEKRHPLATIAWILSLALLPIVGFPVYWFLGPQRLKRQRSRRALAARRIRASMPDPRALGGPVTELVRDDGGDPRTRQLVALALNNSEAPVSGGNAVRVLRNGQQCYEALEAAVRAARHHVHFQYYIFEPDETGRRFRDLLTAKAREGVQVRLLVDAVGSIGLRDDFFAPLVQAGGEVGVYNRVSFARFRPLNFRNHRKIAVLDGSIGFTGGLNVGDEYLGRGESGAWRDTHLRVCGPAVKALQLLFLEDWNYATAKSVTAPAFFETRAHEDGASLVQIVGSGPDREWQAIQQVYFAAISGAQDRVCLTTPYFVPDEPALEALTVAALRGVDVQLLLPRRTDARIARAAARSFYDDLLRAGVRIWEYLPGFLHAKTLVVDGRFATVGSANFDQRSFRLNFEVNALVYGPEVARELEQVFEQDLTVSREITAEERANRSALENFGEASARLLSPLL